MSPVSADRLKKAEFYVKANLKDAAELWSGKPVINALILGDSGVGKTRLAKTCPKPILLIDADRGMTTLRKQAGIKVIPNRSWAGLIEVMIFLIEGKHDFQTFYVDGISHLQYDLMYQLLQKKAAAEKKPVPDQSTWNELKKAGMLYNDLIQRIANKGIHVITTCHQKLKQDDEQVVIENGPDLQGDFRKSLPKAVDIVGYAVAVEKKADGSDGSPEFDYWVLTQNYGVCRGTKDRWAEEGQGIDATTGRRGVAIPDVTKWIEAISEGDEVLNSSPATEQESPAAEPAAAAPATPGPTEQPDTAASEKGEPTDPEGPAPDSETQPEQSGTVSDAPAGPPSAAELQQTMRTAVETASEEGKKDLVTEWVKMIRVELDKWAEEHEVPGKIKLTDVDDVPFLMLLQEKMKQAVDSLPF